MKIFAVVLALSLAGGWNIGSLIRDTNSRAAVSRGIAAFSKGDFKGALQSFTRAEELGPGPRTSFDLGTSQLAAGDRARGNATLRKSMADPVMKPAALYNSGSSDLLAKEYDGAIKSLVESLRLNPNDKAAKRNLEIAQLRKRQQEKQQQGGGGAQKQQQQNPAGNGAKQPQKPQQQPSQQEASKNPGDLDAESVLRSVEQQEREELSRMRRARRNNEKIGW